MADEEVKIENEVVAEKVALPAEPPENVVAAPAVGDKGFRGSKRPMRRGGRPRRPAFERAKPEFDQKIIDIRRTARVMSGGRRFSFGVALVIGDRKGSVGVGTGKAGDTSLAIDKAFRDARKNLVKLSLTKNFSVPHMVEAKYSSARVMLMPNRKKGLVAGSAVRNVLELAGVRDTTAKVTSGSKNSLNMAQATLKAISRLMPPKDRDKARPEENKN